MTKERYRKIAAQALAPLQVSDDDFNYVVDRVVESLLSARREAIEECEAILRQSARERRELCPATDSSYSTFAAQAAVIEDVAFKFRAILARDESEATP